MKYSGAKPENKVLLVLDNHESHISLQAWDYYRAIGIVVVSLPPHCSHKCQPLDISVFGPLKTAYYKRCDDWMKSNPGKRISQYEVSTLFGDAYCFVASVAKCVSGFKSAGIFPLNSGIFTDEDFAAAENLLQPIPSTSTSAVDSATVTSTRRPTTPAKKRRYSVEEISPLPTGYRSDNKAKRKCKRSEVISSSPMKDILCAKEAGRMRKSAKATGMKKPQNQLSSQGKQKRQKKQTGMQ